MGVGAGKAGEGQREGVERERITSSLQKCKPNAGLDFITQRSGTELRAGVGCSTD